MRTILAATLFLSAPGALLAQPATTPRLDASVHVAYANTWDDEGSIGGGRSLGGDLSFLVTPRLGLGVAVERVANSRDAAGGALAFDGHSTLTSAVAQFRIGRGSVQPMVRAGYGLLTYAGTVTSAPPVAAPFPDPRADATRVVESRPSGRASVVTGGTDLDIVVSDHMSLRPGFTVHLMQTNEGAVPWMIWRAGIGVAVRW